MVTRKRGPSRIIAGELHRRKAVLIAAGVVCLATGLLAARVFLSLPDLWGLCLMAAGTLLLWWLAGRCGGTEDHAFLQRIMLATMGLRCGWAFVQHKLISAYYYTLIFAADAAGNHRWSAEHVGLWREGLWHPSVPPSLNEWHMWATTLKTVLLYRLLGPSPFIPEALTITTSASAALAIYLTCRHIGGTRAAAKAAAALTAFLPSLMFWSTQDLKDPILSCCAAWSVFALVQVQSVGLRPSSPVLLGLADVTALLYRAYAGLLLVCGQALAGAYAVRLPPTVSGRIARGWLFLLLAPPVIYISYQEMRFNYEQQASLPWLVQISDQYWEAARAEGIRGSDYELPLRASTPSQALWQLPVRVLLLFLTPIPFVPGTIPRMLAWPEMLFLYFFVVRRFVRGLREAWGANRQGAMVVLLSIAPWIIIQALKTSVSGEAIRMRSQFLPELLVFAGIGHAMVQAERERRGQAPAQSAARRPRRPCLSSPLAGPLGETGEGQARQTQRRDPDGSA